MYDFHLILSKTYLILFFLVIKLLLLFLLNCCKRIFYNAGNISWKFEVNILKKEWKDRLLVKFQNLERICLQIFYFIRLCQIFLVIFFYLKSLIIFLFYKKYLIVCTLTIQLRVNVNFCKIKFPTSPPLCPWMKQQNI